MDKAFKMIGMAVTGAAALAAVVALVATLGPTAIDVAALALDFGGEAIASALEYSPQTHPGATNSILGALITFLGVSVIALGAWLAANTSFGKGTYADKELYGIAQDLGLDGPSVGQLVDFNPHALAADEIEATAPTIEGHRDPYVGLATA